MAGTIGIKIANGDFYPIIEENSPVKKRLVLTTVHDRQNNVKIDLFRSISKSMLDAQYIGSLLIEKISSKPKGDPSIEMVISVDKDGNISAEAYDLDAGPGGERHTLNVSLQNMDTFGIDDTPDFDFDSQPHGYGSDKNTKDEQKFPWLVMGLATLFVALAIAALWFFFLGGREAYFKDSAPPSRMVYRETPPVIQPPPPPPPAAAQPVQPIQPPPEAPPAAAQPVQPIQPPPEAPPAAAQPVQPIQPPPPSPPPAPPPPPPAAPEPVYQPEPPVIKAPVSPPPARPVTEQRVRPMAPVMSFKVPAVIPKNGVVYQIQWGDTLWDISYAFYRNPWLYSRIARDNKIRNPDHIIAGSNVRIYPNR